MNPTEDTPTNPKVPDSIKGTGYYTPMDLVPEEPAAVQQDDKLTAPQSPKTGAIPSQSDNSGAMQQLREAFQLIIEEIVMQGATYADSKDGLRDKNYVRAEKRAFRELAALFQKEQLQLVTELEGELPDMQTEVLKPGELIKSPNGTLIDAKYMYKARNGGYNEALDKVTAILEHKKQELERGE